MFGVFRVKNHDFTQIIFFPILGGGWGRAPPPPWIRPCLLYLILVLLRYIEATNYVNQLI